MLIPKLTSFLISKTLKEEKCVKLRLSKIEKKVQLAAKIFRFSAKNEPHKILWKMFTRGKC